MKAIVFGAAILLTSISAKADMREHGSARGGLGTVWSMDHHATPDDCFTNRVYAPYSAKGTQNLGGGSAPSSGHFGTFSGHGGAANFSNR